MRALTASQKKVFEESVKRRLVIEPFQHMPPSPSGGAAAGSIDLMKKGLRRGCEMILPTR